MDPTFTAPKRTRFLIVENDPNDAFLIKRALAESAHCGGFMLCRNPSEAKAFLCGAGMYADRAMYPLPDVIISDFRMGHETGAELVSWVREQQAPLRDVPVIILSGSCSPVQLESASKVGANSVHRKPSRLEDLQDLLKSVAKEFSRPTNVAPARSEE